MFTIREDKTREHRIDMEIVVDCYNEIEQVTGWYCYLEDTLNFPFQAKCITARSISPLKKGDVVEVTGMAAEDECKGEMFVETRFQNEELAVPLSQLESSKTDKKTKQAIEDWHYWVGRGYGF